MRRRIAITLIAIAFSGFLVSWLDWYLNLWKDNERQEATTDG